jgi:hypothetical protein
MKDMLNVRMVTDGVAVTGTFPMEHPMLYAAVTSLRIPLGAKLNVAGMRISGASGTILMKYKENTAATEKIVFAEKFDASIDSHINIQPQIPIEILSNIGTEYVWFEWSQSAAAVTYLNADIEIISPEE